MRVFKLKRETMEGQFSLDHWQLYVGDVSDSKGNTFKGMSILGAHGEWAEFPFTLSAHDARRMVKAIDAVLKNELPVKYSVKTGVMFTSFRLHFKKYISDWHGGGGYKSTIAFTLGILGFSAIYATISKNTLVGLRDCLVGYYGLGALT